MNDCSDDCDLAAICSERHWSIYAILILCSVIFVAGRITTLGITTASGTTPFMSANDRSRWVTIVALGDHGRYEIDDVITGSDDGIHWDTIDKVQHFGTDGQLHFYSSKPTLLPTMLAWLYRGVRVATGLNLKDDPLTTARLMILIFNLVPWAIYLWLLGKILEGVKVRDWTRYFIVATAGFGTYLSTFAITLNNHLPAAVCVMAAIYGLVRIVNFNSRAWPLFAITGLTAAFAAANELPALSFLLIAGLICLVRGPVQFLVGFLPATAIVGAGFFWTNYQAHDDWRTPYAHRSDGPVLLALEGNFQSELDAGRLPDAFAETVSELGFAAASIEPAQWPWKSQDVANRWIVNDIDGKRLTITLQPDSNLFQLRAWNNWYDYPGSYWLTDNPKKSIIDRGEADWAVYLFHTLFGHHGIFSLTPIWLLSAAGIAAMIFMRGLRLRWLAAMAILLSIVLIGFYVFWVPEHDRNYGGRTSAFRWAFWLAPLWLVCMSPTVDWLGRSRTGRLLCLTLLGISAASALYSSENPWVHPWLYEYWQPAMERG